MPENGSKKKKDENSYMDSLIKEIASKIPDKAAVYDDRAAEKPKPEADKPVVYDDRAVTASASPEGKVLCPKKFFAPKKKGGENEEDTIDLSVCTNPRCPYWRGYGTNGRRVVITPDQKAKEEAVLAVDCCYAFEDADAFEAYNMIMQVLADVPLEKAKSEKKDSMGLSEVDKLIESYKATD